MSEYADFAAVLGDAVDFHILAVYDYGVMSQRRQGERPVPRVCIAQVGKQLLPLRVQVQLQRRVVVMAVFRLELQPQLRLGGSRAGGQTSDSRGRHQERAGILNRRLGFIGCPRILKRQHFPVGIDEQVVVLDRPLDNRIIFGHVQIVESPACARRRVAGRIGVPVKRLHRPIQTVRRLHVIRRGHFPPISVR
ncbi:MAG: hypothetical protein K0Q94_5625 [Paenibacillus sp.]|nr:hypothetical protein [Paenibacillus sp.]